MKTHLYSLALFAGLAVTTAHAGDWFKDVGTQLGRIEPAVDGSIWLARPWADQSAITLNGLGSSCLVTQIHLLPPAGQEKAWLATLLSAAAAGKPIAVFGDCVSANSRIDATRLVIDL